MKQIMRENGIDQGNDTNPVLMKEYRSKDDIETLTQAMMMLAYYDATMPAGTDEFQLDDEESFILSDSDEENRV